jgi:hypothetical protein
MHRPGFARLFHLHSLGIDLHDRAGLPAAAAPCLACAPCLPALKAFQEQRVDCLAIQGKLSFKGRLKPVSQRKPVFFGSRLETAKGADGALAWAFGGLDGLDEEVIGVGFASLGAGAFADVHLPLCTSQSLHHSKTQPVLFSRYISHSKPASGEIKDLRATEPLNPPTSAGGPAGVGQLPKPQSPLC